MTTMRRLLTASAIARPPIGTVASLTSVSPGFGMRGNLHPRASVVKEHDDT
jgi:hypothetical protein